MVRTRIKSVKNPGTARFLPFRLTLHADCMLSFPNRVGAKSAVLCGLWPRFRGERLLII